MVDLHSGKTVQGGTVQKVNVKLPIRLVLYGGARILGDNGSFYNASKNVIADYKNDLPVKSYFISKGMLQLVEHINSQPTNTIQSLDIFCHGSELGLYSVIDASMSKSMTYEYGQENNLASNIYRNSYTKLSQYELFGGANWSNCPILSDINFNVFTNESKIEIHGCNTAIDGDEDSFSALISLHLFRSGKTKSVVIGHTDYTVPNRGGTKEISEQDYRHGQRAIFHNGKLRFKTRAEGRIATSLIKKIVGS